MLINYEIKFTVIKRQTIPYKNNISVSCSWDVCSLQEDWGDVVVGFYTPWYMTEVRMSDPLLDLNPYNFKAQEVLGSWDFAFNIFVKDTFNFWVLNEVDSLPMSLWL